MIQKCAVSTCNSPSTCAERRHIKKLIHTARKKGVPNHGIIRWIHRHEGELVIERFTADGKVASSLPCVMCKNVLDKYKLKWTAYIDNRWVKSSDTDLPDSVPTSRQSAIVFKRGKRYEADKITRLAT